VTTTAPPTNQDPNATDPNSQTNGTPAQGNTTQSAATNADATAAATVAAAANAQNTDAAAPGQSGPAKKSKDSSSDQSDSTATDATQTAASSDAATNAPTPVATVIVANSAIDSTPGSSGTAASNIAIGAQTKARAQIVTSRNGGQDAGTAQNANNTTNANTTSADATATNDTANAGTAPSAAQAPDTTANGAQAPANFQQALNQTAAAPDDAAAQTSTTIVTAHGDGLGATGSPDGTGQASQTTAVAKTATGEVPTVGFVTANVAATATQSVAATSATNATTPTVSMSGLPVAIASRAQAGSSQFDIRLDPPELGHIEVQLNVDSSGQVTSHITADRQDTLNLLQNQQPQLQQALEQAGLKTSDNAMQFSLRDQSFAGQQQQNQNFGQNSNNAQSNTQQIVIPDSSLSSVDTSQIYSRLNLRGGLDIRV
jgi:chemotaxis protein MotD